VSDPIAPLTPLQTVVEDLAACLCAELADGPSLCFCGVLPGAAVPLDVGTGDDCGGMAYVRVTSVYPSTVVGVANLAPANCTWATGFDLELGVYRPFPIQHDGSSPDPDVQLECTRWQMWDVAAMQKALACCDWLDKMDFVVGQYAPAGPAGGVLGGIIPVSAMLI
jgi:hypothetical protein